MERNSSHRIAATTLLAPIAWGTTYVTITELLPAGRPLFVAAMRVLPAGLALLLAGRRQSTWRPRGREWRTTALLALFNFALFFPLLILGAYRLPGGVAAAFGGLQPLLVPAVSWAIVGRRPRAAETLTGIVAAAGVALVVLRPGAAFDPVGLLVVAAATVSFAVGVVLTKRSPASPNSLASTGWQLVIGGVPLAVLALVVEGPPPALSLANVVGFAYLSLIGTALAFVVWFGGIRRLPTAAPPLLGLAAPLTGVVLGWLVLGQSMAPVQLVGFAITIGAMVRGATLKGHEPSGALDVRHLSLVPASQQVSTSAAMRVGSICAMARRS
jgi:probable blue pigment (indigoidine) exporter